MCAIMQTEISTDVYKYLHISTHYNMGKGNCEVCILIYIYYYLTALV